MEELTKHVNELAVAVVALTAALGALGAGLIRGYAQLRAARRDADAADALARVASQAAIHHRSVAEGAVESVETALRGLTPETARLVRDKMRQTQVDLGVQSDVKLVVDEVRRKSETPDMGIKLPEGDQL